MIYVAIISKSKISEEYTITIPDFPGLVSSGKTLSEATKNIKEGILLHVEGILQDSEKIPPPRDFEYIKELYKDEKNIIFYLINYTHPIGKLIRVNISIGENILLMMDLKAKEYNMNRSEYIQYIAKKESMDI